jgi:hypothetical protein
MRDRTTTGPSGTPQGSRESGTAWAWFPGIPSATTSFSAKWRGVPESPRWRFLAANSVRGVLRDECGTRPARSRIRPTSDDSRTRGPDANREEQREQDTAPSGSVGCTIPISRYAKLKSG